MTVVADESLGTIDSAPAAADSVATPGTIPYQAVNDHELERFDDFIPPKPVAVAGVFAGIFVATLADAVTSMVAPGPAGIGVLAALLIAANALSLGVAVTAGIFAWRGRSEIGRMLEAIRRRASITLPSEDESAEPI
jgi:hypothetical protein